LALGLDGVVERRIPLPLFISLLYFFERTANPLAVNGVNVAQAGDHVVLHAASV
jgi:hypothetical protein